MVITERTRMSALDLAHQARKSLEAKHGREVVLLDLRRVTPIADFAVIATGASGPQVKAMIAAAQADLKALGVPAYRRSGTSDSGWMVLDYVDVVIHVFSPEARAYYAVEELWAKALRVP